ncbi:MAG: glycosyltransferase family 39 protein, partial [Anaerolineae bacterium]|nr:glycosyltransferase family 39 protein [Anaerolineae bacterium]
PYYLLGVSRGIFNSLADMVPPQQIFTGGAYVAFPSEFLAGRAPIILLSILTVPLVYLIGRRLYNDYVGLIAAAFLSLSPIHTLPSHFIQPNSLATFFVTLAFYLCLRLYHVGSRRSYLIAGFFAGLSIAAKYNVAPIVLVLIVAHLLREGWRAIFDDNLILSLLACGLGFFVGAPYTLLDLPGFLNSIASAVRHYSMGDVAFAGNPLLANIKLLILDTEGIIPLLALAGAAWIVRTRDKAASLTLVFAISYFLFTVPFKVTFERTHMPLVPFLDILAAIGIYLTAAAIIARRQALRRHVVALAVAISLLAMIYPAIRTIQRDYYLSQEDIRTTAARWIYENIPEHSRILQETFTPVLDPDRYEILAYQSAAEQPLSWLQEQDVHYVILSEANYGPLYNDPAKNEAQLKQYEVFFRDLIPVQKFIGPFQERVGTVTIYAVP